MTDAAQFDTRTAPGHQTKEPVIHSPTDVAGYRMLSGEEVALVNKVKALGEQLSALAKEAESSGADPRTLALARTNLQQGCMWLTRSITKPTTFA